MSNTTNLYPLPTTEINDAFLTRYLELDKKVKAMTKERDAMKDVLKAYAQTLETESYNTESYTVKVSTSTRYVLDTKLIKADFPEIYDVYGHDTPMTKVTIKKQ